MSERPVSALEAFYDEFLAQDATPATSTVDKDIINAVHGDRLERGRDAVVGAVQESGALPIVAAGTMAASSVSGLLSPVLAAAHSLSRGPAVRQETGFVLPSNDVIVPQGSNLEQVAKEHNLTLDELLDMNPAYESHPDFVEAGARLRVEPLERGTVIVPQGSNLEQVAEQHHMTLDRLLDLNPKYKSHPDFVEAGARLRVEPAETSAKAPKHHPRHAHRQASAKPAPPVTPSVSKPKAPAAKAHRHQTHHALAVPINKPKKPTLAKAAPATAVKKAPVPNKPRQTKPNHHSVTTTKPGLGFGNALWSDIGQPFTARAAGKAHHRTVRVRHLGECASTGHMFGKTPRQVVMNYFMICQGDSVAQAAGVVGNLTQESSLQPEEIQNGGFSKNPADAGQGGYGIAQWTPGSKATNESKKYGIKGPIYTLQAQLALVSAEMKGQSPTGQRNMAQGLKQVKDPSLAAEKFEQNFEEGPIALQGGGQLANRQNYAREAAREFNSPALLKGLYAQVQSHRRHEGRNKARSRSHHTAGNAAIYYAALKYKPASYSETMIAGHEGVSQWHKNFPKIGPNAFIDCSGLVNLAVSDATGGRDQPNENTKNERQDHKRWQRIRYSNASRGDLIQPVIGKRAGTHVEIINYTKGDKIYTFGAHTNYHRPQPKQVGPDMFRYNHKDVFLRYVGSHHTGTKPAPKPRAPAHAWKNPMTHNW
jgi:cell wall-associated NlpC family hydrolase